MLFLAGSYGEHTGVYREPHRVAKIELGGRGSLNQANHQHNADAITKKVWQMTALLVKGRTPSEFGEQG